MYSYTQVGTEDVTHPCTHTHKWAPKTFLSHVLVHTSGHRICYSPMYSYTQVGTEYVTLLCTRTHKWAPHTLLSYVLVHTRLAPKKFLSYSIYSYTQMGNGHAPKTLLSRVLVHTSGHALKTLLSYTQVGMHRRRYFPKIFIHCTAMTQISRTEKLKYPPHIFLYLWT